MKYETETQIIKTCPSCSDATQNILYPCVEAHLGNKQVYATLFPIATKIARSCLPVEVNHRCTNCGAKSTWDLVQADPFAESIDYTLRVEE